MATIDYKQKIKDYMNSSEVDTLYKSMLNNLFPELKESEDEGTRKRIIALVNAHGQGMYKDEMLTWLEKQGEHANFLDKIQVGDKVTRNEDGVLVNLSQLKRVAKRDEKQGEQKPVYNGKHKLLTVERAKEMSPFMRSGFEHNPAETEKGAKGNEREIPNSEQRSVDKVEPKFKKGDMVSNGTIVLIVDSIAEFEGKPIINSWYFADSEKFYGKGTSECDRWEVDGFRTATKAECNYLLKMMSDAGYVWDTNKLELMEIEQKPADETPYPETLEKAIDLYYYSYGNGEGGFEHLSLEKFRDIVHTFVSDYGQKPAWSEEDEVKINRIVACLENLNVADNDILLKDVNWLKSIKNRVLSQPKQEWSEEDLVRIENCISLIGKTGFGEVKWLQSLKDRVIPQPQPKQEWSKEDETIAKALTKAANDNVLYGYIGKSKLLEWLKSLKDRYTWKPSDEQMQYLSWIANIKLGDGVVEQEVSKHLNELLEDLKKLREG